MAVLVALIATLFTYRWLEAKSSALQNIETQPVIVAKADLPWGTVLTKDMVKTVPYLKKSLASGYFPSSTGVEGRTLIYPVKSNEPIFDSKLAPIAMKGGGVAAVIPFSHRAMAVRVDKIVGVAGFIHPGNRVDVLVTLQQTGKVAAPVAKTVLENILVLAVGPEIEVSGKQEKPAPVDVITLEVTPQDGEKLALAAAEGKLQLALRNFSDAKEVLTKGTTISTLLGMQSAPTEQKPYRRPAPVSSSSPAKSITSVEFIKGNKTSEMSFN